MTRSPLFIGLGAFAFCCLLLGGAMWLRASLASAYARGEEHGRVLAAAAAGVALARQNSALEAVRRAAERQAEALEVERDALREKLDDLEKTIAAAGAGDSAAPRRAACLDAGLVRALDAIRRPDAGAPAP